MAQAPGPGLYPNVPAEIYHSWFAASHTLLTILRDKTPAHVREYLNNPPQPTPAMVLGSAIHAAILQPDEFKRLYVRKPDNIDRRTKAGKEAWAEFKAAHAGATILEPDDYELCLRIRDVIHTHPKAKKLVTGMTEVSAVWMGWYGVKCKARFDCLPDSLPTAFVDVKTVTDASPRAFSRAMHTHGWHLQATLYRIGAHELETGREHPILLAVEKDPPHAFAMYRVGQETLMAGEDELRRLLEIWATKIETGEWPGYPDEIQDIQLPGWAWSQIPVPAEVELL